MIVHFSFTILGNKANCGKPLGPALIPYGVDVNKIVEEINKLTKNYEDMFVNIEINLDSETRDYKIKIPRPKATELIKEYAKNDSDNNKFITLNSLIKIANLIGTEPSQIYSKIKELEGTCKSMHIKIEK